MDKGHFFVIIIYIYIYIYIYINTQVFGNFKCMYKDHYVSTTGLFELFFRYQKTAPKNSTSET